MFTSLIVRGSIVLLQYMGFIPFVPELDNFDYAIVSFPISGVTFVDSLLTSLPAEETCSEYRQLLEEHL